MENPPPAGRDEARSSVDLRDVFGALPAVSAVTVGVLYGLGVLLSVSQLVEADMHVSDTLPLIPLQDHLAKGLAAVFTSFVLFAAAFVAFCAVLWGYASSRSFERHQRSVTFFLDRAQAAASLASDARAWKAQEDQLEQLEADIAEAVLAGLPDDDPRVAALASRADELKAVSRAHSEASIRSLDEGAASLLAADAAKSKLDRFIDRRTSVVRVAESASGLLACGLILSAGFVPLDVMVPQVCLGVLAFFGPRLLHHYPTAVFVALMVAGNLVPFVIAAYVNPSPFPAATITTDTRTTRGGLITSSGDRYVITHVAGSYKVVPGSEVKAVAVEERARDRPRSIAQLLRSALRS